MIDGIDSGTLIYPVPVGDARRSLIEGDYIAASSDARDGIKEICEHVAAGQLFVVHDSALYGYKWDDDEFERICESGLIKSPFHMSYILVETKRMTVLFGTKAREDFVIEEFCFYIAGRVHGTIAWGAHSDLRLKDSDFSWLRTAIYMALIVIADSRSTARRVEADAKLNKARVRRGKPPIPSYWSIEPPPTVLGGPASSPAESKGGTHASPRPHDRRAHPRHLSGERVVWVRSTRVNALLQHLTRDRAYYEVR